MHGTCSGLASAGCGVHVLTCKEDGSCNTHYYKDVFGSVSAPGFHVSQLDAQIHQNRIK